MRATCGHPPASARSRTPRTAAARERTDWSKPLLRREILYHDFRGQSFDFLAQFDLLGHKDLCPPLEFLEVVVEGQRGAIHPAGGHCGRLRLRGLPACGIPPTAVPSDRARAGAPVAAAPANAATCGADVMLPRASRPAACSRRPPSPAIEHDAFHRLGLSGKFLTGRGALFGIGSGLLGHLLHLRRWPSRSARCRAPVPGCPGYFIHQGLHLGGAFGDGANRLAT